MDRLREKLEKMSPMKAKPGKGAGEAVKKEAKRCSGMAAVEDARAAAEKVEKAARAEDEALLAALRRDPGLLRRVKLLAVAEVGKAELGRLVAASQPPKERPAKPLKVPSLPPAKTEKSAAAASLRQEASWPPSGPRWSEHPDKASPFRRRQDKGIMETGEPKYHHFRVPHRNRKQSGEFGIGDDPDHEHYQPRSRRYRYPSSLGGGGGSGLGVQCGHRQRVHSSRSDEPLCRSGPPRRRGSQGDDDVFPHFP